MTLGEKIFQRKILSQKNLTWIFACKDAYFAVTRHIVLWEWQEASRLGPLNELWPTAPLDDIL